MTPELTHVRLLVRDMPAAYGFYTEVLGLVPTFGGPGDAYVDLAAGGDVSVALFAADEMDSALDLPAAAGGRRVCLVLRVEDVDAAAAEVIARGASLAAPPTDRPDWGLRTAHLLDPDGNVVELYADLPR